MDRASASAMVGCLLAAAAPALAQTSPPAATVPRLPAGIPGFLDPATNTFHPLDASGAAAPTSGTVTVSISWSFLEKYETVSCELTVEFGNESGGQFFANHSASASDNFSSENPVDKISLDFDYTPNGSGTPELAYTITCAGYDESGGQHSASESSRRLLDSRVYRIPAFEDF